MVAPLLQGIGDGVVEDISGLAHYRRVLFASVVEEALYPRGACGSYAGLLVKLLKARGFPVRFGQMLDREDVTGIAHHIVVEVLLDGRWVICDPMYDLVFRGDDGRILGYEEIRRDWDRLKTQCPPEYNMAYSYRGFRRVNYGRLNAWLQHTPLAQWSIRTWLNEGAWLRSALVASLLVLVAMIHVWYERGRSVGHYPRAMVASRAASASGIDAHRSSSTVTARGEGLLVHVDDEPEGVVRTPAVAEPDHLPEVPGGVDLERRERHGPGGEGLAGDVRHAPRVLAD